MRIALVLIALSALLTFMFAPPVSRSLADQPEGDGWVALFDGESIDGWTKVTGFGTYRIEDGAIVGTTADGSPNTFLCSPDTYRDFELRFEVKVDDALNSGVQIRSRTNGDPNEPHGGVLRGPQVEVEAGPGQAGYIYAEASGGWISPQPESDDPAERQHDHFRNGEWNRYRVLAEGRRIRTWINGTLIADVEVTEEYHEHYGEGVIGLQVHGIGRGSGPYSVRWRELYLREIEQDCGLRKPFRFSHAPPPICPVNSVRIVLCAVARGVVESVTCSGDMKYARSRASPPTVTTGWRYTLGTAPCPQGVISSADKDTG